MKRPEGPANRILRPCEFPSAHSSRRIQVNSLGLLTASNPALLLTPIPTGRLRSARFGLGPGSLPVRQRQRRNHPQHAAEQPPTQMPFGQ